MSFVFVICENGLNRDENALRVLLGPRDVKVVKADGETLTQRSARLVQREFERRQSKFVLVVHRDADEVAWADRKGEVEAWFRRHKLGGCVSRLIPVVPAPCVERWLCLGANLRLGGRPTRTSRPCDPWKKAWETPAKPEFLRLRPAIEALSRAPPPDLKDFLDELNAA